MNVYMKKYNKFPNIHIALNEVNQKERNSNMQDIQETLINCMHIILIHIQYTIEQTIYQKMKLKKEILPEENNIKETGGVWKKSEKKKKWGKLKMQKESENKKNFVIAENNKLLKEKKNVSESLLKLRKHISLLNVIKYIYAFDNKFFNGNMNEVKKTHSNKAISMNELVKNLFKNTKSLEKDIIKQPDMFNSTYHSMSSSYKNSRVACGKLIHYYINILNDVQTFVHKHKKQVHLENTALMDTIKKLDWIINNYESIMVGLWEIIQAQHRTHQRSKIKKSFKKPKKKSYMAKKQREPSFIHCKKNIKVSIDYSDFTSDSFQKSQLEMFIIYQKKNLAKSAVLSGKQRVTSINHTIHDKNNHPPPPPPYFTKKDSEFEIFFQHYRKKEINHNKHCIQLPIYYGSIACSLPKRKKSMTLQRVNTYSLRMNNQRKGMFNLTLWRRHAYNASKPIRVIRTFRKNLQNNYGNRTCGIINEVESNKDNENENNNESNNADNNNSNDTNNNNNDTNNNTNNNSSNNTNSNNTNNNNNDDNDEDKDKRNDKNKNYNNETNSEEENNNKSSKINSSKSEKEKEDIGEQENKQEIGNQVPQEEQAKTEKDTKVLVSNVINREEQNTQDCKIYNLVETYINPSIDRMCSNNIIMKNLNSLENKVTQNYDTENNEIEKLNIEIPQREKLNKEFKQFSGTVNLQRNELNRINEQMREGTIKNDTKECDAENIIKSSKNLQEQFSSVHRSSEIDQSGIIYNPQLFQNDILNFATNTSQDIRRIFQGNQMIKDDTTININQFTSGTMPPHLHSQKIVRTLTGINEKNKDTYEDKQASFYPYQNNQNMIPQREYKQNMNEEIYMPYQNRMQPIPNNNSHYIPNVHGPNNSNRNTNNENVMKRNLKNDKFTQEITKIINFINYEETNQSDQAKSLQFQSPKVDGQLKNESNIGTSKTGTTRKRKGTKLNDPENSKNMKKKKNDYSDYFKDDNDNNGYDYGTIQEQNQIFNPIEMDNELNNNRSRHDSCSTKNQDDKRKVYQKLDLKDLNQNERKNKELARNFYVRYDDFRSNYIVTFINRKQKKQRKIFPVDPQVDNIIYLDQIQKFHSKLIEQNKIYGVTSDDCLSEISSGNTKKTSTKKSFQSSANNKNEKKSKSTPRQNKNLFFPSTNNNTGPYNELHIANVPKISTQDPYEYNRNTINSMNSVNSMNQMNPLNTMNSLNPLNPLHHVNPINSMNQINHPNEKNLINDKGNMIRINYNNFHIPLYNMSAHENHNYIQDQRLKNICMGKNNITTPNMNEPTSENNLNSTFLHYTNLPQNINMPQDTNNVNNFNYMNYGIMQKQNLCNQYPLMNPSISNIQSNSLHDPLNQPEENTNHENKGKLGVREKSHSMKFATVHKHTKSKNNNNNNNCNSDKNNSNNSSNINASNNNNTSSNNNSSNNTSSNNNNTGSNSSSNNNPNPYFNNNNNNNYSSYVQ